MNKLLLSIIISFTATSLIAQSSELTTITFKPGSASLFLSSVDTIYFKSPGKEIKRKYFNVVASDSILKLDYVPIGKYNVEFVSQGFYVSAMVIVICSKCGKEFEYFAEKSDKKKERIFTIVEEMPRYIGGNVSLADDFQKSLSKSDAKILQRSPNFSISFFVTKDKELSDISFSPSDLSKEIKAIVRDGIIQTKNWQSARQNGRPCDDMFTIDKQALMK